MFHLCTCSVLIILVFDLILYIVFVVSITYFIFAIKRTLALLIAFTVVNEFKHIYVVLVPKFMHANLMVMVSGGDV